MTKLTVSVIAAGMFALLPAGALARGGPPIVVTGPEVSVASWSARVARSLDRNLTYPMPIRGAPAEGAVAVKFLCSENGTPSGIAIARSSGSRVLDAAAMRAVAHIATLHPLPDGITHAQLFEANILYATTQRKHDRQMAALLAEARDRNASFANPGEKVALNIGFAAAR
jgi:protein TonB